MTLVTLSIDNLDSTAHALLIAKADYLCNALDKECDGARWAHVKRSIEALDDLYAQIERARLRRNIEAKQAT